MSIGFHDSFRGNQCVPLVPRTRPLEPTGSELAFSLDNDPARIAPVIRTICEHLQALPTCDRHTLMSISLAMDEALANALYHGNLEVSSKLREGDGKEFHRLARERRRQVPYRHRSIDVEARLAPRRVLLVVRDEGPGFDTSKLADPRRRENLDKPSGRGVMMMRHLMDEVRFNAKGNEVRMAKYLDRVGASAIVPSA